MDSLIDTMKDADTWYESLKRNNQEFLFIYIATIDAWSHLVCLIHVARRLEWRGARFCTYNVVLQIVRILVWLYLSLLRGSSGRMNQAFWRCKGLLITTFWYAEINSVWYANHVLSYTHHWHINVCVVWVWCVLCVGDVMMFQVLLLDANVSWWWYLWWIDS